MPVIVYSPRFVRDYKKLVPELQTEVKQAIERFRDGTLVEGLRIHKLEGRLSGKQSFSVNYKIRVIFKYLMDGRAALLTVGDHDIYR